MARQPWYYEDLREEHLFNLSLSRLRGESNAIFSYLMGDWKKDSTKLFWEVLSCNRLRLQQGKFWLSSYQEKFLHKEYAAPGLVHRYVVEQPSLEILKAQMDTALPISDIWSWLLCEQEVGPDDLHWKGPFSPEFFYDSNVPHDMCAKILRALNISSLVSGISNTFISWKTAQLTQILYILSKCN